MDREDDARKALKWLRPFPELVDAELAEMKAATAIFIAISAVSVRLVFCQEILLNIVRPETFGKRSNTRYFK